MFAITKFFLVGIFINTVFFNQEVKSGISKLLSENPSLVTAVITTIVTIVLAFITWSYLKETKKMREIAYESLQVDASPKVFISAIVPEFGINVSAKKLVITPICSIKNVGKTEAKRIETSYEVLFDDEIQVERTNERAPYIFPTQEVTFNAIPFAVTITANQVAQALRRLKEIKRVLLPANFSPKVLMNLTIKYIDHNEEEKKISYLAEYSWHQARWGIKIAEEETENSESPQA